MPPSPLISILQSLIYIELFIQNDVAQSALHRGQTRIKFHKNPMHISKCMDKCGYGNQSIQRHKHRQF